MYAEVTRVLVSSGTQVQSQIIPNPDYLPDYLSISHDYALTITLRYNHINLSSTNSNTSYSDITRRIVQSTISFSLNEHDFPPLSVSLFFLMLVNQVCINLNNLFKGYVRCNHFSTNEFLMSNNFIYREFNSITNFHIPHKNVLSSSYRFDHFSLSFYEYLIFINSVFYNSFNVYSVTNILYNDLLTCLFDRDNRFLFCNYKVTGECINIFHQSKNKSNMPKIYIT